MASHSCDVQVIAFQGEDFGRIATLVYVDGGGIDISPSGNIKLQLTEDVDIKAGDILTLTLSSKA